MQQQLTHPDEQDNSQHDDFHRQTKQRDVCHAELCDKGNVFLLTAFQHAGHQVADKSVQDKETENECEAPTGGTAKAFPDHRQQNEADDEHRRAHRERVCLDIAVDVREVEAGAEPDYRENQIIPRQ